MNKPSAHEFGTWPYLTEESFKGRYALAAYYLKKTDAPVLEIGGYPNTIAEFLPNHSTLYSIDPKLPENFREKVTLLCQEKNIIHKFIQEPLSSADTHPKHFSPFQLLYMGMDLCSGETSAEDLARCFMNFLELILASKNTIIEIPLTDIIISTWNLIEQCLNPKISIDVCLDFSKDPAKNFFLPDDKRLKGFKRRLVVFQEVCPLERENMKNLVSRETKQLWQAYCNRKKEFKK